jgi:hypothetical protein
MLNLNRRQFINPEMSKYIKEQTNKWLEKYSKTHTNTQHHARTKTIHNYTQIFKT